MIGSIQLLRGLAALSVVIYHTDYLNSVELMGVSVFFVISGFIVTHATRENASYFITKRIIRVVPLYWAITIFAVIWFWFGFSNPPYTWPLLLEWSQSNSGALFEWLGTHYTANATQAFWHHLITTLFFIPTIEKPILGVGWTLNLEMLFYAVFAICLLINRKWAPVMAGAAILVIKFMSNTIECGPACVAYGTDYMIFFALGISVFYLWRSVDTFILRHKNIIATASITVILYWPLVVFLPRFPAIHYGVPSMIVLAALCLHTVGFRMNGRGITAFGAISYALYLLHPIVIETLRASSTAYPWLLPSHFSGMISCVAVSVIAAAGAYYMFEKPVLEILKARVKTMSEAKRLSMMRTAL